MTRAKICGITRIEDGLAAARCGADAIGLVFYPASPRHVSLAQAKAIAGALPPFVSTVGLFVNPDATEVEAVLRELHLDVLQFHGDETPQFCAGFGVPYLKAARVKPGLDLLQYTAAFRSAQGLLLDAFVEGQAGGTGQSFDWKLIPAELSLPLILSGGLDADNVRTAIERVRPWAVDVSSGVEACEGSRILKGIKDAAKIAAFMQGVRSANV